MANETNVEKKTCTKIFNFGWLKFLIFKTRVSYLTLKIDSVYHINDSFQLLVSVLYIEHFSRQKKLFENKVGGHYGNY